MFSRVFVPWLSGVIFGLSVVMSCYMSELAELFGILIIIVVLLAMVNFILSISVAVITIKEDYSKDHSKY